jgi:L-seryl-tRNA(Ser) seleniumtransferase
MTNAEGKGEGVGMNFYERMGLATIVNASETYTILGGSLMDPRTLDAMTEAALSFVDLNKLITAVCRKASALTKNEAAFVTTGAAGGVVLTAAACICGDDLAKMDALPAADQFEKNEILIYKGGFLDQISYWKLAKLTGAKIVRVDPSLDAISQAVNEHTAAFFMFPASLYEKGVPTCEETIPVLKKLGVPSVVDVAAQLPPTSNLWYYTRELGANAAIFSGGKHIKGPQSTGLIVGDTELIDRCRLLASPNTRIGRAFKTGKEELAGFITALEIFVNEPEEDRFNRQLKILLDLERGLSKNKGISFKMLNEGRLGTHQPLLLVTLPQGKSAVECNKFTRNYRQAVDVGVYPPEFGMPEDVIFLNAYNLKAEEVDIVVDAITDYILEG